MHRVEVEQSLWARMEMRRKLPVLKRLRAMDGGGRAAELKEWFMGPAFNDTADN